MKVYNYDTECPIAKFIVVLGGKWKPIIIWLLLLNKTMRFNEIDKAITGITQKMLSQQLKELEADGLLQRIAYPVIPPKVEYTLTPKGKSLEPILTQIIHWVKVKI